jgi:type II secretory pathway predicted ATPase ExeA
VLLAIDEAHLLDSNQLDAVRMLTNHGMDYQSPVTILLIGQPTLRRRLRVGDMAALEQRVALRYHIPAPALTPAEADGYIRAHLAHAGRTDTLFSDDAVRHEAPSDRAEVKGLRRLAVAAAG